MLQVAQVAVCSMINTEHNKHWGEICQFLSFKPVFCTHAVGFKRLTRPYHIASIKRASILIYIVYFFFLYSFQFLRHLFCILLLLSVCHLLLSTTKIPHCIFHQLTHTVWYFLSPLRKQNLRARTQMSHRRPVSERCEPHTALVKYGMTQLACE